VESTCALDFPGYAIGGLSVGETFSVYEEILGHTAPQLPADRPRYVMGIGTPEYILSAIRHGIDMFDCVFPTRAGRTGTLFTSRGRINIKNAAYAKDTGIPDPEIASYGGERFTLAYLRHLFQSGEILGAMLATEHNLRFLEWLVRRSRETIREGTFASFYREVSAVYPT
jgi:queuine tRNA-ribosyltransferase